MPEIVPVSFRTTSWRSTGLTMRYRSNTLRVLWPVTVMATRARRSSCRRPCAARSSMPTPERPSRGPQWSSPAPRSVTSPTEGPQLAAPAETWTDGHGAFAVGGAPRAVAPRLLMWWTAHHLRVLAAGYAQRRLEADQPTTVALAPLRYAIELQEYRRQSLHRDQPGFGPLGPVCAPRDLGHRAHDPARAAQPRPRALARGRAGDRSGPRSV